MHTCDPALPTSGHPQIGVWYVIFSILGVLAEIRVDCLREGLLRPFGFLHSFIGRGCAYMLLGCVFCSLPILPNMLYVTLAPGVVLVVSGMGQFGLGCFVVRGGGGGGALDGAKKARKANTFAPAEEAEAGGGGRLAVPVRSSNAPASPFVVVAPNPARTMMSAAAGAAK